MNDFDDERTMEEEEALEANEEEDRDELSALEQEQVRFAFSFLPANHKHGRGELDCLLFRHRLRQQDIVVSAGRAISNGR